MIADRPLAVGCLARLPNQPFAGSMARAVVRRLVRFRDRDAESGFMVAVTEAVMSLSHTTSVDLVVELDGAPQVRIAAVGPADDAAIDASMDIVRSMVPEATLGRSGGRVVIGLPVSDLGTARPDARTADDAPAAPSSRWRDRPGRR